MKFLAIKKWEDGNEQTIEYFHTLKDCLTWIKKQKQPIDNSWKWMIGEY